MNSLAHGCLDMPSMARCVNFQLSSELLLGHVARICNDAPGMVGCSVARLCASPDEPFCAPFALYKALCTDNPELEDCQDYTRLCAEGSVVKQCEQPIRNLPSTRNTMDWIQKMCSMHAMPACADCTATQCRALDVYAKLCNSMPGMLQCRAWTASCQQTPKLRLCQGSTEPGHPSPPSEELPPPMMKMYVHAGMREYFLFESFVPSAWWQFLLANIIVFALSVGWEGLQALLRSWELTWARAASSRSCCQGTEPTTVTCCDPPIPGAEDQEAPDSSDTVTEATPFLSARTTRTLPMVKKDMRVRLARMGMKMLLASGGYALMLLVMTYNVCIMGSVVVGLGVGSLMFGGIAPVGAYADPCCT